MFRDMGLANPEAEQLRADLAFEIHTILKRRKLTQEQAAALLGIDQSEISRLKNGEFSRFSAERLIGLLKKLNRRVEIRVHPPGLRTGREAVIAA